MRFIAFASVLILSSSAVQALDIEDHARFGPSDAPQVLRVISTADIAFFEPMIETFIADASGMAVDYTVASSTDLNAEIANGSDAFDVAISSAMDLQTKLANDGKAMRYASSVTEAAPEWAVWNDMLFAFNQEPAALVLSRNAFRDLPLPQDRQDVIDLLRQYPERFRGRIGTYDVRQSGLGYLFATQDARTSETYWRLTENFGALGVKLYCCSSDMIDAVQSGELAIAYNVLGSYAVNREDREDFEIVLPNDFTTLMLRTAIIPTGAAQPELAGDFIDHLLSQAFSPFNAPLTEPTLGLRQPDPSLTRIRIGPGLLVFLDQLKKNDFLNEWQSAIGLD